MSKSLLNNLSPAALSAALRGGTAGWGKIGSTKDVRYAEAVPPRSRRRCHCGCKQRATMLGMANGLCLMTGCEFDVRYWVKHGFTRRMYAKWKEHMTLSEREATPQQGSADTASSSPSLEL